MQDMPNVWALEHLETLIKAIKSGEVEIVEGSIDPVKGAQNWEIKLEYRAVPKEDKAQQLLKIIMEMLSDFEEKN